MSRETGVISLEYGACKLLFTHDLILPHDS